MTGTVPQSWPSIDDLPPAEQGGPTARTGFNYQDEITVSFFLEMLADDSIEKVHCETHDDLVVKRVSATVEFAEYVQVKGAEPDKLWSLADLCASPGGSLFEKSLSRDGCKESSRFRVITLRPVTSELKVLTYPCYGVGREPNCQAHAKLSAGLKERFPDLRSPKGNGPDFWVEHCLWDERHDETSIRNNNLVVILTLSARQGLPLLPEQANMVADGLRQWAWDAGRAKWIPDRALKIITRSALKAWWDNRLHEIVNGAASPSGGKLAGKMQEAQLEADQLNMALDLRRDYAGLIRTPRYMDEIDVQSLQRRVKSELASLRGRHVAGQLNIDPPAFHALCLERMDALNSERPQGAEDRSAFLKGCMYDITDRCLHRFTRNAR
jgi:hypothetical protein